jgi:hypothetical protein
VIFHLTSQLGLTRAKVSCHAVGKSIDCLTTVRAETKPDPVGGTVAVESEEEEEDDDDEEEEDEEDDDGVTVLVNERSTGASELFVVDFRGLVCVIALANFEKLRELMVFELLMMF